MKVLVATEKPFAKIAVDGIKKEIEGAGFELALLEKYTDKAQLLDRCECHYHSQRYHRCGSA